MKKRFLEWYRSLGVPQSLFTLAKKRKSTSRLYIVRMETDPGPEHRERVSHALQRYRDQYGIDFMVLGPGISFERFDDF